VIDSKEKTLPIGTKVSGAMGCRTHAVMPGKKLTNIDFLGDLPLSYGVGVLGLSG
jgi:NADPH-dependent curcumin reductase CurA